MSYLNNAKYTLEVRNMIHDRIYNQTSLKSYYYYVSARRPVVCMCHYLVFNSMSVFVSLRLGRR